MVCDLGGWVASATCAGVPYVNLPTTLLAMVDGALGGKVAVNHPVAKNLLGAFQQPAGVICDLALPALARAAGTSRAGLAECDQEGRDRLARVLRLHRARARTRSLRRRPAALERLVRAAAAIKTALIERDPYEVDLRRPLNFGHTIGHPLETVTGYAPLLHGEAVAFGMVVEARIAARARAGSADELLDRLLGLLARCGLPTRAARPARRASTAGRAGRARWRRCG